MDVEIRELGKADLIPNLLEHFNRYQKVMNVWRKADGKKVLIEHPFTEYWDVARKQQIVNEDFANCINSGGAVFGAFENNNLIGFSSVTHNFFGSQKQYLPLMLLHVSSEYRGLGLGKQLFHLCAGKAAEWGAKKLYISGHSSEESQAFYTSVGCVDSEEINEEFATLEPYDIQLEYKL